MADCLNAGLLFLIHAFGDGADMSALGALHNGRFRKTRMQAAHGSRGRCAVPHRHFRWQMFAFRASHRKTEQGRQA